MITFVPLQPTDIPQLHRWLNQGEAFRWYGRRTSTELEVREEYLTKAAADSSHRSFIIRLEHEAIGYLQCYRIADYPEYAQFVSAEVGDYGLDLFLGRDDLLGRGLGTRIVIAALDQLIFAQPEARRCLIDPSAKNHRAIRCYEKAGFRRVRNVVSPTDGEECILVCERRPQPLPS